MSWVGSQALGFMLASSALGSWQDQQSQDAARRSSLATEHLVQIKGLFQPGQECCRAGFGTRPGRANTALIEAAFRLSIISNIFPSFLN